MKERQDISVAFRRTETLRRDGMVIKNESFSVAGLCEDDNACADANKSWEHSDSLRDCQLIRTAFP